MTKTDKKHAAQDELMFGMKVAISRIEDKELQSIAIEQFRRVEKLFGYELGGSPYP